MLIWPRLLLIKCIDVCFTRTLLNGISHRSTKTNFRSETANVFVIHTRFSGGVIVVVVKIFL